MRRVRLIHWNPTEAAELGAQLRAAGYQVEHAVPRGPELLRELRRDQPDAVAVDLSRLPSGGRDVAVAIRRQRATRHVPIVFVGGEFEKVARIRGILPDATYTTWDQIAVSLNEAISSAPTEPVVPHSRMVGYAGASLAKRLGIKPDSVVFLVDPPPGFRRTLGTPPTGATLSTEADGPRDLVVWFVRSRKQLEEGIIGTAEQAVGTPLWIAWPKKSSKVNSDVTQQQVRRIGLAAGLVDYKICSIDRTWSGLLFTRRKAQ